MANPSQVNLFQFDRKIIHVLLDSNHQGKHIAFPVGIQGLSQSRDGGTAEGFHPTIALAEPPRGSTLL
ncbi:MAG: hypothetical protein DRP47_08325 [Candidatus Zixiibacteriota bacterium]|nr:MAG: hypothetical protein DRP47_08325 [candidate division Zixibacteria bacterium]